MTKVPSVAPIFMAFFLLLEQPATSTGPTLKKEAYLQACSLAQTLQALPGLAALQTTTSKESLNNLEEAAGKLSAVAEADTNADEALVIFAVAAELAVRANDQTSVLLGEAAASIKQVATTQQVAGGILEFYHMLSVAASGSTGGCLNDNSDDGTNLVTEQSALTGCDFGVPAYSEAPQTTIENAITTNGFSALKGTNVKGTGSGAAKCVLFQDGSSVASKLFQAGKTISLAGGTLNVNTAATLTATTANGRDINAGGASDRSNMLQAAHSDSKAIIAKGKVPAAEDAKATAKQIVLGPQLKSTLAKLLQKLDNADSSEGYEAKAAAAIDNVFGGKAADFDSKWTAFMENNVDGSKNKGKPEVQVSSLANFKEITDVLLYYRAKDKLTTASLQKEIKELKKGNKVATKQTETDATCKNKRNRRYLQGWLQSGGGRY